ncbi:MAG: hypothetical protein M3Y50_04255 [Acidobacteriota bacterium]|nr:hypothetical protein [Acidobacteriota bacterium]
MSVRTKCILMNAAIVVGLAYKLWKGVPVAIDLVTGLIMFSLVNLILFLAARKSTVPKSI